MLRDPTERRNLAATNATLFRALLARVDALQRAVDQLVDVKLDEEIDALKSQLEKMDKRIAKLEKK